MLNQIVLVALLFASNLSNILADSPGDLYKCPNPSEASSIPLCDATIEEAYPVEGVTFSCPDGIVNSKTIVCIIVKDLMTTENGGTASIVDGGLGQYYVDIELKARYGKGLKFHVQVYTRDN